MSMGYRFEIRDFRIQEGEWAEVKVANVGVAPIYRSAFVSVEGVRGEYDLKQLMPGESQKIRIPCKATAASVPVIECDHLVEGQEIQYQASVQ